MNQFVVSLYIVYSIPVFVKVKAYKRFRNGKKESVRSYYRRVHGYDIVFALS